MILGRVVVGVKGLEAITGGLEVPAEVHVLFDEELDTLAFVELEKGHHLVALNEKSIAFIPEVMDFRPGFSQLPVELGITCFQGDILPVLLHQ